MGYTKKDLEREIMDLIDSYMESAGIGKMEVVAEIRSRHSVIEGEDADFALVCVHYTVSSLTEKAFRDIKNSEESSDAQRVLPGFDHIQKRYIVEGSGGERVAISVDAMSSEQIHAKCDQLRAMGRGLFAHADELERYAQQTGRDLT